MKERDKRMLRRIARNLVRLREARGLSQAKLADLIDDYSAVISRIEAAEHMPGAALLFRIAEGLKVDVSDFFQAHEAEVAARAS